MGETFLERGRGKRQADVMPSMAFLLDFLEKKRSQQGKEMGGEEGKEGNVVPFLLQRTLCGKLFRKRERRQGTGEAMPYCAFFLNFLEKKRRQEGKGGSKEDGKESKVMPFYCKERCGGTCLEEAF